MKWVQHAFNSFYHGDENHSLHHSQRRITLDSKVILFHIKSICPASPQSNKTCFVNVPASSFFPVPLFFFSLYVLLTSFEQKCSLNLFDLCIKAENWILKLLKGYWYSDSRLIFIQRSSSLSESTWLCNHFLTFLYPNAWMKLEISILTVFRFSNNPLLFSPRKKNPWKFYYHVPFICPSE